MKWSSALLVLPAFFLLSSAEETQEERGYLLTAPKIFRSNSTEQICLSLLNLEGGGKAKLTLTGEVANATLAAVDHSFADGSEECFPFPVPPVAEQRGRLHLQLTLDAVPDYEKNESEWVNIREYQNLLFVQTDKSLYLPGQDVRFRILVLDAGLKPLEEQVREVWVENPSGVRTAQWKEPASTAGFVQLEYKLPQEPPQGNWKIKVDARGRKREEEKQFEVAEYVLPKYSVNIQTPKVFLGDASTLDLNICARYTHGGAVEGELSLKVDPSISIFDNLKENFPGLVEEFRIDLKKYTPTFKLQVKGCHKESIATAALGMDNRELAPSSVNITATVKEKGTGIEFTESVILQVERNPLEIDVDASPSSFKPGFVYNGQVKVKDKSGSPARGQKIQICKDPSDGSSEERMGRCRNFTTDSKGLVRFQIPPQVPDESSFGIQVSTPGLEKDFPKNHKKGTWEKQIHSYNAYKSVNGWHSPSKEYIHILHPAGQGSPAGCGETLRFDLLYSTSTPDAVQRIHYQVMARGDVLVSKVFDHKSGEEEVESGDPELLVYKSDKKTPIPKHLSKASVEIPVTPEMAPESKLVVFYIRPDGEVVSDHLTFRVDQCLSNKVELKWKEEEVGPGSKVGLKVKAEPESVCGLRVVDKSVDLLRPGHQLNLEKVFEALERFQIYGYEFPSQSTDNGFCLRHRPSKNISDVDRDQKGGFRGYDSRSHALTSFDRSGLLVLSDLRVYTLPCRIDEDTRGRPGPPVAFAAASFGGSLPPTSALVAEQKEAFVGDAVVPVFDNEILPVEVRDYFPETWLWSLEAVGETGELELDDLEIPDTITEWVGSAVCSSPLAGLGLSPSQSIIASQPFFLDLNLPYSIKRGEILPLQISIFNYKEHPLPVQIEVKGSESFKVDGDTEKSLCLKEQGKEVVTFDLDFSKLGEVNITVVAQIYPSFPDACGPDVILAVSDAVVKPVRVEPEGFPVEKTKNWYFCEGDGEVKESHSLSLPEDVVPDSARAWVTASGDLLGPSLQGIKSLVRLPTGCGEQNMVALTPNIFLLQYFNTTDQLKPELKAELVHNMEIGYQRELKYKHDDGSFSAFGKNDEEGSMWLTAFVVKGFGQSLPFIPIDQSEWQESVKWITSRQLENGCFPNVGRVLMSRYQGGLDDAEGEEGSETGLSAYVLISLLESGAAVDETVRKDALQCLKGNQNPSTYTLALTTYAFVLAGERDLSGIYMDKLLQRATEKDGLLFWHASPDEPSDAVDIETTSYGILSLVHLDREGDSARALSAVRWIASKRNSKGGFTSTQDTVMALQALALYASHAGLGDVAMDVHLSSSDWEHNFTLTDENRLVQQMIPVPSVPSEFQISSAGKGCALVQATLRYSVSEEPEKEGMRLSVEEMPADERGCDRRTIQACVMYSGPTNTSNMALLQVSMVSGYKPDEDGIQKLRSQNPAVKRTEVNKETGELTLYFDQLDGEGFCLDIPLVRAVAVKNPKPALVKLFDYYAPEIQDTELYSVGECVEKKKASKLGEDEDTVPDLGFGLQ